MPTVISVDPIQPQEVKIRQAADVVKKGGLMIYPTETVYGLGSVYTSHHASERIFSLKGRNRSSPLLLLIRNIEDLSTIAEDISKQAMRIAEKFWPGPLTLLFKASTEISTVITGNSGKIGCRISSCPVVRDLLEIIKEPITSTSANLTGAKTPQSIMDISCELSSQADIVVDAGTTTGDVASTIIDVSAYPFSVVRSGAVDLKIVLDYL